MKKNPAAKNYYDILEVSRTSSSGVIRAAYKVLMQKYHPDKNTETTNNDFLKKTNLIRTAYECLSDEIKRKEYDLEVFGELQVGSEENLDNGNISQKNDADFTVETTMGHFYKFPSYRCGSLGNPPLKKPRSKVEFTPKV